MKSNTKGLRNAETLMNAIVSYSVLSSSFKTGLGNLRVAVASCQNWKIKISSEDNVI